MKNRFAEATKSVKESEVAQPEKEATPKVAAKVETPEADAEVGLDESDLKEFEESKKVPYQRFKEVNDSKKTLQAQIEALKKGRDEDVRRAVELAELRVKQSLAAAKEEEDLSSVEPWQREVHHVKSVLDQAKAELNSVKAEVEQTKLEAQLDRLKEKFPEADDLAVLGWKKQQPHADLADLMELSHARNLERQEAAVRRLVETKKQRRESVVPVREGGIKLKPEERPKNLTDVRKLIRKHMGV